MFLLRNNHTVRGLEFSYRVSGETVIHTRSKATLSRSDFEKAICLAPQKPSDLHNDVAGPSYEMFPLGAI